MRGWWPWIFRLIAIGFVVAGVFHARAFFDGTLEPRMSSTGHAIFVGVNAVAAFGMWTRPRWFVLFFAVLCVQQLYSHGDWAWTAWKLGQPDPRSWMVLITMPPMLILVIVDARRRLRREAA